MVVDQHGADAGRGTPSWRRADGRRGRVRGRSLGAAELPLLLDRVHAALAAERERIDQLNVFPVPDGDTGTNMTLTVRAGLDALRAAMATRPRPDPVALAQTVTHGAVRGARGNSGVIVSQVVRAVVEVVAGHRRVDAARYAAALRHARDLAYEAVAQPVEGTILTVIDVAAREAEAAVADGDDLVTTSARTCAATRHGVDATRDQLDVLRRAGVVDAGARGFEVVLAAVHAHLTGEIGDVAAAHLDATAASTTWSAVESCSSPTTFHYEVQYLLETDDGVASVLRGRLEQLGDSVVVVAAGGLLNVHVHTDDVDAAIAAGAAFATPSRLQVTRFDERIAERRGHDDHDHHGGHEHEHGGDGPGGLGGPGDGAVRVVAVAVVSGDGVEALVRDLGAVPVAGAAGALPSVAELLEACAGLDAETAVLLPGHRNVVPTARQAADLARAEGRRLEVVDEAISTPAVLAALAVLDGSVPAEAALAELRAAAVAVRAGEVVAAVRDADTPVGHVCEGQPLAVVDGNVVGAADDPLGALATVCDLLDVDRGEIVTLVVGTGVDDDERDRAESLVRGRAGRADVEVVVGGQRKVRYVVGCE